MRAGQGIVALALLVSIGGCMTDSGTPKETSSVLAADKKNGVFHHDLTTAPAPSFFGLTGENPSAIFDRGTGALIDVDLTLPEGGRLQVPAFQVNLGYLSRTGNEIVINSSFPGVAAARTRLQQDLVDLGLDSTLLTPYLAALDPAVTNSRVFHGTTRGYLMVSVEVRTTKGGKDVVVNYELSWGGPPLPTYSPPPT
jgi:hypothetical protein